MTFCRLFPVILCGCLVVPATRTTTRAPRIVDGPVYEDADAGLQLTGDASGRDLAVHATRLRDCHRDVLAVTDVVHERYLKLGGSDDPRAQVFGIVLAPVLIPVSAVVSELVVINDDATTSHTSRVDHVEKLHCTRPADGLAVALAVPSGRVLHATTDATGTAHFTLPVSEPYRGAAIATAETHSATIAFDHAKPAVTAVRDAALACAAAHQRTGALRVSVFVDSAGEPAAVQVDGDDAVAACITSAIALVTFPPAQRGSTVVLPLTR
jgi:hypothetical protein